MYQVESQSAVKQSSVLSSVAVGSEAVYTLLMLPRHQSSVVSMETSAGPVDHQNIFVCEGLGCGT